MRKILFISMMLLVMAACKKEMPGANEVWIQNNAFVPSSISVPVNTTVGWTNKDGVTHNVTGSGGAFSSGNITNGGTYSFQFTKAGTFPYSCTIHPGMNGTVIVK